MDKNVAGQKIRMFAFDKTTGTPKTGDAANITCYVNKDWAGVTVLGDTSATEIDATNAAGYYLFDLTQAESNANALDFSAKSSTANIVLTPLLIYTFPASFTSFVTPDNAGIATINAVTDLALDASSYDGKDFISVMKLMASAILGKASGMATTTAVFRAVDDSKTRITATVDADGNRSAVTLDAT